MEKYPAEYTVHWPTGPVPCCQKHAAALRGLANSLGGHVNIEAAAAGAQCMNCVNEAELVKAKT